MILAHPLLANQIQLVIRGHTRLEVQRVVGGPLVFLVVLVISLALDVVEAILQG